MIHKRVIIFCLFFIGAIIYTSSVLPIHSQKEKKIIVHKAHKVLAAVTIPAFSPVSSIVTGMPTPSPATIPSPTQLVYTGYCLHVPVLMYHHIMPYAIAKQKGQTALNVDNIIFDQHMGYLAAHGYTTIFAEDIITALKNHTSLPSKSIVVTIDDGYEDNYTYAFPVIKRYNIKTSLMVPTGLLGVNSGANNYFSWSELQEMIASGLIRGYNHTFSHFAMGTKDATKDQFEVGTAQQQLHNQLGITNTIFAYPYGTNATSLKEWNILQQNNISGAFSTIGGAYQCDSFIYSLHRTRAGNIPFPAFGIQ